MSNDFDDFFADSASFSPEGSNDYQFFTPVVPSGALHEIKNTSTPKDDDFDWFSDNAGGYQVRNNNHISRVSTTMYE